MRSTDQRHAIIDALRRIGPASPSDIHQELLTSRHYLSPVTVYRNLAAFFDAGLIHKHPSDGRYFLCSAIGIRGPHELLQCTRCGRVQEVRSNNWKDLPKRIERGYGFRISSCVIATFGVCDECEI